MHEYSISSQIWASVSRAAREQGGGRVLSIVLEVGVLNLLEEEQLSFWIGLLAEREGSPNLELKVTTLPGRVRCRQCGEEGEGGMPEGEVDHLVPFIPSCKVCGSHDVIVSGGREIRVVSAEVEKGEAGEGGA